MANPKHVELLKKGSDAWNAWRSKNPAVRPDLSGAHMSDTYFGSCDLHDADMREAVFQRSNFSGANFRKADLRGIDLWGCDLSQADFTRAKLHSDSTVLIDVVCNGTVFRKAKLANANLSDAHFSQGTDFGRADLSGASLEGSYLCGSKFKRAVLRGARLHDARCQDDFGGVDFRGAVLDQIDAEAANFRGADLTGASVQDAYLESVNLTQAILVDAEFQEANLENANCRGVIATGANFTNARLVGVNFSGAELNEAILTGANLEESLFVRTQLDGADLSDCRVFGMSAWELELDTTIQSNLRISPQNKPASVVENLELAQLIYLLWQNKKVKGLIDTVTSTVVLILGRFTTERKKVLNRIRLELRELNYTPIMFDFDGPDSKDDTGAVETIARLSRFVIADLTDPSSIPHELATIVPHLRTTPILSVKKVGETGYQMFDSLRSYPWVVPDTHEYTDMDSLIEHLPKLLTTAEDLLQTLRPDRE